MRMRVIHYDPDGRIRCGLQWERQYGWHAFSRTRLR